MAQKNEAMNSPKKSGSLTSLLAWVKKNYVKIAIGIIFALGIFLRSYNFSDWIHFELDQSRDAKVIDEAIQKGPEKLPLLGPRAGGTFLRLGPVFYYIEYLSALVFGNTPEGIAVCVLIFGLLSLPLFYLYARIYFDKIVAVALLAVYSVSLYLVTYSRFAWNPNPLPFFLLLTFYSIARITSSEEKNKGRWLCALSFAIAVATQLHFLAFVSLPIYAILMLVIYRPKIKWQSWALAVLIFGIIYSPMIINDIKTKGANTKEFFKAVTKKSSKNSAGLVEKITRNYFENATKYFLVLAGREIKYVKIDIDFSNKNNKIKSTCTEQCGKDLPLQAISLVSFTSALLLLVWKLKTEKNKEKKSFLVSTLIILILMFGVFTPLAMYLSPRFFLLSIPLPFVFLGLIFEGIIRWKSALGKTFMALIIIALVYSNLYFTKKYFDQLSNAPYKPLKEKLSDIILNERTRVTLQQQRMISSYMQSFYSQNKWPVYISCPDQYKRSLIYLLTMDKIPSSGMSSNFSSGKVYREGNYFFVYPTAASLQRKLEPYLNTYDIESSKDFGTFYVYQLVPKEGAINAERQDLKNKQNSTNSTAPARFNWDGTTD